MPLNLTHWLKKTPQPVTVLADDKRIPVPKNVRAYRDLTQTIKALEPQKLSCLDKDDQVIRSIVLESESDNDEVVAPATPEQSDLQLFARLLSEAYDKGSKTNQPLVDRAMEFVERNSQRLAKAEAEIDRLRNVIHKLNLQIADLSAQTVPESGEAGDGGILGAMVQGVLAAQAGADKPPTPVTPINKPTSGAKPK